MVPQANVCYVADERLVTGPTAPPADHDPAGRRIDNVARRSHHVGRSGLLDTIDENVHILDAPAAVEHSGNVHPLASVDHGAAVAPRIVAAGLVIVDRYLSAGLHI